MAVDETVEYLGMAADETIPLAMIVSCTTIKRGDLDTDMSDVLAGLPDCTD